MSEEHTRDWTPDKKALDLGLGAMFSASADQPESDLPETLGDYRIGSELGRGGMGIVYRAEQISLRREVALKVLRNHLTLDQESITRFRIEATSIANLHHPGIVRILTVGEEAGHHYFAMELIGGRSLDAVISDLGALGLTSLDGNRLEATICGDEVSMTKTLDWRSPYAKAVCQLIIQVADALHHAHERGVIHRDVKPSNILIEPDGTAVLMDFGLARQEGLPHLTQDGTFAGTPHYSSPEQAAARSSELDQRTDVFSLGVTLYEMLTLTRPFGGETCCEVLEEILTKTAIRPRNLNARVPRDLETITLKALEKSASRRYASAEEFADDLRAFLAFEPIRARPPSLPLRSMRWIRKHRLSVGAVALAIVVATASGLYGDYRQNLPGALQFDAHLIGSRFVWDGGNSREITSTKMELAPGLYEYWQVIDAESKRHSMAGELTVSSGSSDMPQSVKIAMHGLADFKGWLGRGGPEILQWLEGIPAANEGTWEVAEASLIARVTGLVGSLRSERPADVEEWLYYTLDKVPNPLDMQGRATSVQALADRQKKVLRDALESSRELYLKATGLADTIDECTRSEQWQDALFSLSILENLKWDGQLFDRAMLLADRLRSKLVDALDHAIEHLPVTEVKERRDLTDHYMKVSPNITQSERKQERLARLVAIEVLYTKALGASRQSLRDILEAMQGEDPNHPWTGHVNRLVWREDGRDALWNFSADEIEKVAVSVRKRAQTAPTETGRSKYVALLRGIECCQSLVLEVTALAERTFINSKNIVVAGGAVLLGEYRPAFTNSSDIIEDRAAWEAEHHRLFIDNMRLVAGSAALPRECRRLYALLPAWFERRTAVNTVTVSLDERNLADAVSAMKAVLEFDRIPATYVVELENRIGRQRNTRWGAQNDRTESFVGQLSSGVNKPELKSELEALKSEWRALLDVLGTDDNIRRATLQLRLNHLDDALTTISGLLAPAEVEKLRGVIRYVGWVQEGRRDDLDSARKAFRRAQQQTPRDPQLTFWIWLCETQQGGSVIGDRDEIIWGCRTVVGLVTLAKMLPDDVKSADPIETRRTLSHIRRALESTWTEVDVWAIGGGFDGAVDGVRREVLIRDTHLRCAFVLLAMEAESVEQAKHHSDLAERHCTSAISLDSTHWWSFCRRAEARHAQNDNALAFDDLQTVIDSTSPESAEHRWAVDKKDEWEGLLP